MDVPGLNSVRFENRQGKRMISSSNVVGSIRYQCAEVISKTPHQTHTQKPASNGAKT